MKIEREHSRYRLARAACSMSSCLIKGVRRLSRVGRGCSREVGRQEGRTIEREHGRLKTVALSPT